MSHDETPLNVGEKVRELRLAAKLTQDELARKMRPRVERTRISQVENGHIGVGPVLGKRLARALATNGDWEGVYEQLVAARPPSLPARLEALEDELRDLRARLERLEP